jgi:hypothetical protein
MENEPRKMSVLHTKEKRTLLLCKILNANFSHYGLKERKSAIKIIVVMVRRKKYENITIEKTCKICQFRIMW